MIKKEFPQYLGNKFERAVMELVPHLGIFQYTRIGRWWHKDKKIDIIALNENTNEILFAECKWKNKKTDVAVLTELFDKAKFVEWNNDTRKEYFMVASKSGFTQKAQNFAKQNNFMLITVNEL